jgi:UDP-N-acetylglucosamine 2-epimerase (non-hydrolysing)
MAPICKAFNRYSNSTRHKLCHTGQHFDTKMSQIFFDQLDLPNPDFYLGINGGSQTEMTARIMQEFEKIALAEKPDLILVPGDVNSTLACGLVASKLGIEIGHIESGLRSFDRSMPEEINRIVTDVIADHLFVTEQSGVDNLTMEGVDKNKIHLVGNVMIDSLINLLPQINQSSILQSMNIRPEEYILVTFHRPSNVDEFDYLLNLINYLNELSKDIPIVFPIHPRTRNNLQNQGIDIELEPTSNFILTEPIGYIDFLALTKSAKIVITDSGGIQEETTFLQVQCVTVRDNTERPITVDIGTNHLVGTDINDVKQTVTSILNGKLKKGEIPQYWDGRTSERIVNILLKNEI